MTIGTMQKLKHIAVAGNIGAGKTTLSEMLSKHYKWDVLYEDTNTNPYLSDFTTTCTAGHSIFKYTSSIAGTVRFWTFEKVKNCHSGSNHL